MKKNLTKHLILSSLLTMSTASMVAPTHSFADEKIKHEESKNIQLNMTESTLGPQDLSAALTDVYSNIAKLNIHAATIMMQKELKLEGISIPMPADKLSQFNTVGDAIKYDQQLTRDYLLNWLNELSPMSYKLTQNVEDYNKRYQQYYQILDEAIKGHNKPMLLNGIKRLKTSVQTNQENVKQLKDIISRCY